MSDKLVLFQTAGKDGGVFLSGMVHGSTMQPDIVAEYLPGESDRKAGRYVYRVGDKRVTSPRYHGAVNFRSADFVALLSTDDDRIAALEAQLAALKAGQSKPTARRGRRTTK